MSNKQKYGKFDSWTIVNDNIAEKRTDKSFFAYNESGVPMGIRWFFGVRSFPEGQRDVQINLHFEGSIYIANLNLHKDGKVRVIWHSDLGKELNKHYFGGYYPLARFERIGLKEYHIEFIFEFRDDCDDSDPLESAFIPQSEGQKKEFYVTRYERKQVNRTHAIKIHGTRCMVCGFDFKELYGDVGCGYIEVHHVKPLHELDEEVTVNPETDLVCLCSNCHRMIHRKKNGVFTVDELPKMIGK